MPTKKAYAFLGIGDITLDPFNLVQNTISAIADPPTAVGTVVSATNDTIENVHQFGLRPLAWALSKSILQGITAQTVGWINSGFNGNPAYITNPDQFFLNVGDQTVSTALGANGGLLSKICTPFQPAIRLALVQQYLQQDQLPQQCSISQIVKNYDGFIQNFENGGWSSWFAITQSPGGNPYSAYILAQDELSKKLLAKTTVYQKQLDWGQGFLSYERCTEKAPVVTTLGADGLPTLDRFGQSKVAAGQGTGSDAFDAQGNLNGNCLNSETVTPGSVINETLKKSLGSGIDQLNLVNDINQIVGALLVQGIKGVVGGISGGLRGLSQSSATNGTNSRPLVTQLLDETQSTTAAGKTVSTITDSLPGSLSEALTTKGNSLMPVVDEAAITADLAQKTATFQTAANTQGQTKADAAEAKANPPVNTSTNDLPTCGNNICEGHFNENNQNCSQDCTN